MFQSIKLLKSEPIADGKLRIVYQIKDTCFAEDIELIGPHTETSSYEPVAILKVYARRSLNIVRNLAIYYLTIDGANYIAIDAAFLEHRFPTLNYRKLYSKTVRISFDDYKQMIARFNRAEINLAGKLGFNLEATPI